MNNLEKINKSDNLQITCAVIPFYNEENTIRKTVIEVLKYADFVIAVNDGSTDSSLRNIEDIKNIIIINLDKNLGKGIALKFGFKESIKLNTKYTFTIDADLQHDPTCIPKFLNEIINYDIIIGNRLHYIKDMPIQRRASNLLTSYLLTKKLKTNIKDSQCGYRVFRTDILNSILPKSSGFEAESEMLLYACRKKYRIGFVDIPVIYGNDNSKMKSLQAIKGFLKIMNM